MSKKGKHTTTKNTMPKPPVTRLAEYTLDVNGVFTLVTNISEKVFDLLYKKWFDAPETVQWSGESLAAYLKEKLPNNICLLKEDYEKIIEGKGVISATKEEYEAENN